MRNEKIKGAKVNKIKLVFEKLEATELVEKCNIPPGIRPLNSHLFRVEKLGQTVHMTNSRVGSSCMVTIRTS